MTGTEGRVVDVLDDVGRVGISCDQPHFYRVIISGGI